MCIGCGEGSLVPVLCLRQMPVNSLAMYSTSEQARLAVKADIDLAACRSCGLLFNRAFDPTLVDYDGSYENSLHFSPTFRTYASQLVETIVSRYPLAGGRVLEIASGKGEFLELLCQRAGCQGIGIDPSYDGSCHHDPHLTFIQEPFSPEHIQPVPDLVLSRQLLEHIAEPLSFLTIVAKGLRGEAAATVVFEVDNAGTLMLEEHRLWELLYEHVSYFTLASLRHLFTAAGFEVTNVSEVFGRQFALVEARLGKVTPAAVARPADQLGDAQRFASDWIKRLEVWRTRFAGWRANRVRVVVWGAGARGVTLLNVVAEAADIAAAVDINPRKRGSFVAGTGHPVVTPTALIGLQPQVVVLTNSMYETEVKMMLNDIGVTAEVVVA